MKLTKCPNGHFYDADQSITCPECGSLPEIVIFRFDRTAFLGYSIRTKILTVPDDKSHLLVKLSGPEFCSDTHQFTIPVAELRKITDFLQTIRDWKKDYQCEDMEDDGPTWSIEYHYLDFNFESGGYASFPYNYDEKKAKLQKIIEDLWKKYDPNEYDPLESCRRIDPYESRKRKNPTLLERLLKFCN